MAKKNETQTLEQLTARYRELETEKTRVQTRLESARDRLEELLAEADAEFGSRDIGELESKLKELEASNLEKRKKYQTNLDSIEQQLAKIEEQFVDVDLDEEQ